MANPSKFGSSPAERQGTGTTTGTGTGNLGQQAQQAATGVTERAKETASSMTDKAKDMASNVAGSAQDLARRAGEAASNLGSRAEDAMSGVGSQMENLAGTLREKAPHEGMLGTAASSVASGLEAGGRYLQQHDFADIADELTGMIRRYPIQAVLVGIGVGFLFARATRS